MTTPAAISAKPLNIEADQYRQRFFLASLHSLNRTHQSLHAGRAGLALHMSLPKSERWRELCAWQIDRLTSDGRDGLDLIHSMQGESIDSARSLVAETNKWLAGSTAVRSALYSHALPNRSAQSMSEPIVKFLAQCQQLEQRIQDTLHPKATDTDVATTRHYDTPTQAPGTQGL